MNPRALMICLVISFWVLVPAQGALAQTRVIDGATIVWNGQRIRLHGIDAPEQGQQCRYRNVAWSCGKEATRHLQDFIRGRKVTCQKRDTDQYGRMVAVCFTDNVDINDYMVASGYAMAYRRYSKDYVRSENAARAAKRGMWKGEFQPPWEWRKAKRTTPAKAANENQLCKIMGKIKGNISRSGERIYHVPGGQDYSRTRIVIFKGERWFCSEAAAVAAGWRKSKQ